MLTDERDDAASHVNVVLNWIEELTHLVPTDP